MQATESKPFWRQWVCYMWIVHVCLLAGAIYCYCTSATVCIKSSERYRINTLDVERSCDMLAQRITAITSIDPHQLKKFVHEILELDSLLNGLMLQLPKTSPDASGKEFIKVIRVLRLTSSGWMNDQVTIGEVPKLQQELAYFCPKLNSIKKSLPRPPNEFEKIFLCYSTGLLEGCCVPVLVPFRVVYGFLHGKISLQSVVNPLDWRRTGIWFLLGFLHGALILTYACSFLGMVLKRQVLYLPGLISLVIFAWLLFLQLLDRR